MERNYKILTKSNWFATDIQAYYGCSKSTADYIKKRTEQIYGCIQADELKDQKSVSADNVIKIMGGQDRLTEIKIINELIKNEGEKENE